VQFAIGISLALAVSVHGRLIANPGVPAWWPMFCLACDVTAAGCLASLLLRSRISARATDNAPG
jgi:hypothetical protein